MNTGTKNNEDLIKCPVCNVYFKRPEGFICHECKRGPLCRKHIVPGENKCTSCTLEIKINELNALKRQEHSIKSFLHLLQFLFLIFSILFISLRTGVPEVLDFLRYSAIIDSMAYMGGISVIGAVICYIILHIQKNKIDKLQSQIKKTESDRLA